MAKPIKESPQYRVIYDQDLKILIWMDLKTEPPLGPRDRYSLRTFPDYEAAKRGFSEAPEEWTVWIKSPDPRAPEMALDD
jgi:hypothetical protein